MLLLALATTRLSASMATITSPGHFTERLHAVAFADSLASKNPTIIDSRSSWQHMAKWSKAVAYATIGNLLSMDRPDGRSCLDPSLASLALELSRDHDTTQRVVSVSIMQCMQAQRRKVVCANRIDTPNRRRSKGGVTWTCQN